VAGARVAAELTVACCAVDCGGVTVEDFLPKMGAAALGACYREMSVVISRGYAPYMQCAREVRRSARPPLAWRRFLRKH
jgi:hypothetical protein